MKYPVLPFVARPDDPFEAAWVDALRRAMPAETIEPIGRLDEAALQACEVAIVANPRPEDLRRMPRLKWVQSVWAGVERMVADLRDTDLKIVRLVDPQLSDTMAEAVLAWTLYLHRDMPKYASQQRQRQWKPLEYVRPQDKTVSLLGLGALGAAAAARLRANAFRVQGWSRTLRTLPGVTCYAGDDGLARMLADTDILVCLLPLTEQTRGLLNDVTFSQLGRPACLINFGRGAIVDDEALRRVLEGGGLRHAVLDVFATEPLPMDSWHWTHPAVTVLPHVSAPTDQATASAIVAANVAAFRRIGAIPPHVDRIRGY
ncbi:MAG TPA: glyoxylate/hydroxypyruvate reductase A [Roseateles sp.]|uniref:2-hydroxyacid dehydrogenase n=1 Tax=Roseateles sp. TaxID=1971397 RepID=UPI002EDABBED